MLVLKCRTTPINNFLLKILKFTFEFIPRNEISTEMLNNISVSFNENTGKVFAYFKKC